MIQWLKNQYKYAIIECSNRDGALPRLLSLDVFRGQKTDEVRNAFRELNITSFFIPSGCIGYVQVLDVAVNKPIKNRIKELADVHFDTHFDQWNKEKYVVGDRRIMLTQWVGQAWKEFHEDSFDVIHRAFRKLGLSLTIDGSEDDELHVEDLSEVEVGDWRNSDQIDEENDEPNDEGNKGINDESNDEGNEGMNDESNNGGYEYVLEDEMGLNDKEKDDEEDCSGDSEMDEE